MFGYIRAARPELRVREAEYYQSTYCGLCRSMGKCTGQCSRFTISYDFAFLAQVRMALAGTHPDFRRRRCIAHPFRRRRMMERNAELDFCARAAAILAYEKCRDDAADEKGFRRLAARCRILFLWGAYRRAKKHLPGLADTVRGHLGRLSVIEEERQASVDLPAAVFGDLLADVAAYGLTGSDAALAQSIGRSVGKFIYIADAVDDYEKDAKSGAYNPFFLLFGSDFSPERKEGVETALVSGLADLERALDLLDRSGPPERRAVLANILYLGMPATVKKVLYGDTGKEET